MPEMARKHSPVGLAAAALIALFSILIGFDRGKAAYLTPHLKKFTAPDASADDVYGFDVVINGNWLFIGAPHVDTVATDAGAVYIYERNTGGTDNWGFVKKVFASDGALGDHFGISVDADGDTLIVGSYYHDIGWSNVGAAYIFERNQGGTNNWGQVKKLAPPDPGGSKLFGIWVDADANTIVVGAREDGGGPGGAYVYDRNQGGTGNWGLVKKVTASNGASGDSFGHSFGISGDILAVGARDHSGSNGAAYIFSRNSGGTNNWGETKILYPSNTTGPILFGESVALDGTTLVVGAPDSGTTGSIAIFEQDNGGVNNWGLVKEISPSGTGTPGSKFGNSSAIHLDTILAGASEDSTMGAGAGAFYVFSRNQGGAGSWGFVNKITASDGFTNDRFSYNISVYGTLLLSGAYEDDDACPIDPLCSSGSAYLYDLGTLPTPTASATPPPATPSNTPVPPTPTATNTPLPPTATPSNTTLPPTATATNTPVPPTATSTASPPPPTATFTPTATPLPPTATATNTPIPPTATATQGASATPTATSTPTSAPAYSLYFPFAASNPPAGAPSMRMHQSNLVKGWVSDFPGSDVISRKQSPGSQ